MEVIKFSNMTFRVTLIKNRSQNVSGYLGTPLVFGKSGTSSVLDSPSTDKSKKLTKLLEPLKGSDFLSSKLKKMCYELKKNNAEIQGFKSIVGKRRNVAYSW